MTILSLSSKEIILISQIHDHVGTVYSYNTKAQSTTWNDV